MKGHLKLKAKGLEEGNWVTDKGILWILVFILDVFCG